MCDLIVKTFIVMQSMKNSSS